MKRFKFGSTVAFTLLMVLAANTPAYAAICSPVKALGAQACVNCCLSWLKGDQASCLVYAYGAPGYTPSNEAYLACLQAAWKNYDACAAICFPPPKNTLGSLTNQE
jgi:hypothetical protein